MSHLIALQGPELGRTYPLTDDVTILGRQHDSTVCLLGRAVSRHHARIIRQDDGWLVEDLDSSNGTFLNGQRLTPNTPVALTERDALQIGPYTFGLRVPAEPAPASEPNLIIRETVSAVTLHQGLLGPDASSKLQVILDISHHVARAAHLDELLDKLLDKVLELFPQADRALAILGEGPELALRAQKTRRPPGDEAPFSRTIVRRALTEGVGLISDDVKQDDRFTASQTLHGLELRSLMCVPMIDADGRRLGVLQTDRLGKGFGFTVEDLRLLTAIALQVAVVLDNATLHAERLRQQRLHQELELAREIQQGYLPDELDDFPDANFDILGRVYAARQVAGDFYDYLKAPCGKLAFFIGDVSGKAMPAALFLGAVRTLARHLVREGRGPVPTLTALNRDLADDNPTCMFVTLAHGLYDPATSEVLLTSAGHHPPLLRPAKGAVEPLPLRPGRLLGYDDPNLHLRELRLTLAPGDLLVFFTDGVVEARAPDDAEQFGIERLRRAVQDLAPSMPLSRGADLIRQHLQRFTGAEELRDDATLLLLRRHG
ncbi:MAG: SpoIIE family protein phosphatase [Gemmataceae bacterium]|nr:SpoIIE family protein phosphatase [Gemmataceae bacterium]